MSDDSVTDEMTESTSLPADVTDDSSRREFIVPLTTDATQYFAVTGSSFEVKIEADSNDVSECVHDDIPRLDVSTESDKGFGQKGSLKRTDLGEKKYVCTVCGKQFTRKGNLTAHSNIHNRETVYSCSLCEKRFSSWSGLCKHMNIHSDKYMCRECGKCCHDNDSLAVHMRSHSGEKPFECTVCSKRFTQPGNLAVHSRIHSGEKLHNCSLCDKTFCTSGNLQRHKRLVHSNIRPYDCPYCGKLFKTNIHLKSHVRTHTGAKPYSCRHCSERFAWADQLKVHLLESHNEGNWFACHICEK